MPDWIQVEFAGSKTIDEISVFSLHDNYTQENTPTETQTFSLYGLLAFDVQYWNGSSWVTIPGGSVTGNNKVWRKFTFSAVTTNKIRVVINSVPDAWSRVVEIQAFGTSAGGEKVQWLVPDHLGTPRIIVDETGNRLGVKRHDYLPFGEELVAGTGGRTVALGYGGGVGYGGDGVRQQFTGYERDTETSLDYAEARYYSSTQGRFTSIDPLAASATPSNPQTFNRYSYVTNSPLTQMDPSGMTGITPGPENPFRPGFCEQSTDQRKKSTPGLPPPPAGPYTPAPIKIDIGPVPLPEGQKAWPTSLEMVEGPNMTYTGQPVKSPSGELIDPNLNYGVGKTLDYIIRNQVADPMSEGVRFKEEVSPTNPTAEYLMILLGVDVNKNLVKPERGIVPDTLWFITPTHGS